MTTYALPQLADPPAAEPGTVYTVASGDLRPSANVTCWPAQEQLERDFAAAVEALGWRVRRAHPSTPARGTASSTASGWASRCSTPSRPTRR